MTRRAIQPPKAVVRGLLIDCTREGDPTLTIRGLDAEALLGVALGLAERAYELLAAQHRQRVEDAFTRGKEAATGRESAAV